MSEQHADEACYEAMIDALQAFVANMGEHVSEMQAAAATCVENTEDDPAAARAAASLAGKLQAIQEAAAQAGTIAQQMQDELERIRAAAAKADSIN